MLQLCAQIDNVYICMNTSRQTTEVNTVTKSITLCDTLGPINISGSHQRNSLDRLSASSVGIVTKLSLPNIRIHILVTLSLTHCLSLSLLLYAKGHNTATQANSNQKLAAARNSEWEKFALEVYNFYSHEIYVFFFICEWENQCTLMIPISIIIRIYWAPFDTIQKFCRATFCYWLASLRMDFVWQQFELVCSSECPWRNCVTR